VGAPEPLIIYKKLRGHFGFLNWWPGETPFEILVGAILTQQTTWKNVEKAILSLKKAQSLDIKIIAKMPIRKLELLIRSSGYYKQKAKRLRDICNRIIKDHGSLEELFKIQRDELRKLLLSYSGIGKETADSIVLYAANKPEFVIDTYTKRAMNRINPDIKDNVGYDELKLYFEQRIDRKVSLYQDFHAQFVELGKNYCKKNGPLCSRCPLSHICHFSLNKQQIKTL
jgi:endonuclease-3 related protein